MEAQATPGGSDAEPVVQRLGVVEPEIAAAQPGERRAGQRVATALTSSAAKTLQATGKTPAL